MARPWGRGGGSRILIPGTCTGPVKLSERIPVPPRRSMWKIAIDCTTGPGVARNDHPGQMFTPCLGRTVQDAGRHDLDMPEIYPSETRGIRGRKMAGMQVKSDPAPIHVMHPEQDAITAGSGPGPTNEPVVPDWMCRASEFPRETGSHAVVAVVMQLDVRCVLLVGITQIRRKTLHAP